MENHPIPQDVTGFKFKLIGSVTVKQFLYLVAGGILAVVFFMVPLPGIIKYPISFLCGGIGAALAFIPIDGRPMDVMMKNFLKALPAENQYIYHKRGAEALITEFFTPPPVVAAQKQPTKPTETSSLEKKRALLYKSLRRSYEPDEREQAVLSNINSYLDESSQSATPPMQNLDSPQQNQGLSSSLVQIVTPTQNHEAEAEIAKLTKPTIVTPTETPVAKPSPPIQTVEQPQFEAPKPPPQQAPPEPIPQPQAPKVTVEPQQPVPVAPTPMTTTPAPQQPVAAVAPNESNSVTTVNPEGSLKAGFPQLPDTPNIVMGIIKDPRGKIIPNILVEIMDPQGIPVRAFKTNALGQFAAATPLPNGEYNVILEDPRKQNEFEQIHITLDGQIFQPLEIISIDQREKLRRELFGGTTAAAGASA